eukprot:IDg7330t1
MSPSEPSMKTLFSSEKTFRCQLLGYMCSCARNYLKHCSLFYGMSFVAGLHSVPSTCAVFAASDEPGETPRSAHASQLAFTLRNLHFEQHKRQPA